MQKWRFKKRVGLFEIENIDNANVLTIARNPKEYLKHFVDHSDNKKYKGLKKSTPGMDFDSYSSHLCDLTEYTNEYLNKSNKVKLIEQKIFQVVNESI